MIRLRKLPDRTPVKLVIVVNPELNETLARYARVYAEDHGVAEPVEILVPAMLEAFLESDRDFQKRKRSD